jgi:hypothetical protein
MRLFTPTLLLLLLTVPGLAADYYVHPRNGNDAADGSKDHPLKSIAMGIKWAKPGDTVHLFPTVYRETPVFHNRDGNPGSPITLDGHGVVIEGSDPLVAEQWTEVTPGSGLYKHDKLLRTDDAVIGRWFFLFDGKMQHMGRTSKGPQAKLKKPEELEPGEWTWVHDPAREETKSTGKPGTFYVRIAPGTKLADAHIAAPMRSAGVQFSGKNSNIVVRNLIATHVYNDGCNVHGTTRSCLLENFAAIECGDDGFSAHEDAEFDIVNFVSIGNSTGLCDTVSSITRYKNVYIRDCLGYDVFFIGDSPHRMENAIIESSAARAFEVSQHVDRAQNGLSAVTLKNVLIRHTPGSGTAPASREVHVSRHGQLTADHCTFDRLNFTVSPGGEAALEHCLITGNPKPTIKVAQDAKYRNESEGPGADEASLKPIDAMAAEMIKRWKESQ